MDNFTQLWIRACKSKKPLERVDSLCKRFYGGCHDFTIVMELSVIVDDHCNIKSQKLAYTVDGRALNQKELATTLINEIRLTRLQQFTGLTPTLKHRNRVSNK